MKMRIILAVSPLAIALALAGCSTDQVAMRGIVSAAGTDASARSAERFYDLAQKGVRAGDVEGAIDHAEKAVEASPRDLAYRMLLGDLYLKNGRFLSAEMAFGDVLQLAPNNGRALFSLALAKAANGKRGEAIADLDRLATDASPADIGLAYALAGDPVRAVELLEVAARHPAATGRVRQNLALAYAMTGDWQKARITASQDLAPSELTQRMEQWAAFVQPNGPADQVATMLGVTPREDAGQPVQLALAPQQQHVAFAEAEIAVQPEPEPVAIAAAEEPAPQSVYANASAPELTPAPQAAPAETRPAPRPRAQKAANSGRYLVQLAAYGSSQSVKQGWSTLRKRYGFGAAYDPFSASVTLPGKGKVHRLSVGFSNQSEAIGACRSIKAKGGACFVRPNAGDRPLQG